MTDETKIEYIFSYSRADALRDGELVEVTEFMKEKNPYFKVHTVFTRCLAEVIKGFAGTSGEDLKGRAHDVLFMGFLAAKSAGDESSKRFQVLMTDLSEHRKTLTLLLHIGGGDAGEPVITIGFPEDF